MVVTDLDLAGIGSIPSEAEPPLVVDPDGMSSGQVSLERFETIAWRHPKIGKLSSGIQLD